MFRFLLLCVAFFLLYMGFTYVIAYDTHVSFALGNYLVETTLFTFGATLLIVLLLLLTGLKFLFFLFDLPQIIRNRLHKNKLQKLNSLSLKAIADLLMGKKDAALDIANKVIVENKEDNADILHLIKAEKAAAFDDKIRHLRALIDRKNYSLYATKKLAEIFYESSHFAEAEEYGVMAYNKDDTNTEIMLLLIRIYAKRADWNKMVYVVSKLQRADNALLESASEELAKYYFMAAKNALAAEDDAEAAKYLESALKLKVDYLEALTLYTEIKIGMKQTAEVLRILRIAYSYNPNFQIAELFIDSSRNSAEAKYNTLASIVDPKDNNGLYLAIAGYLNLPERINELQTSKSLTSDSGN